MIDLRCVPRPILTTHCLRVALVCRHPGAGPLESLWISSVVGGGIRLGKATACSTDCYTDG